MQTLKVNHRRTEESLLKVPPQNTAMEQAVIAAVMLEEKILHDVVEQLNAPDMFYVLAHRCIWKAVLQLYHAHVGIDLLTLSERLQKNEELEKAGDIAYLMELLGKISDTGNVEEYARVIFEKYLLRRTIEVANDMSSRAYNNTCDAFEVIDTAGNLIDQLAMMLSAQRNLSFADRVAHAVDIIKAASTNVKHITGVSTFSNKLDRLLLGFQPSDLVVVAARPAMGKTSMVWHIAKNQAKGGIPVGFFSLEMNDVQLINKMFASETGIDLQTIRRGALNNLQWQQFDEATRTMLQMPIHLCDTGGISIQQLIAVSKNWVRKQGVKIIYIDYLQLITTSEDTHSFTNREREVGFISRQLKALAKELNVPIVALAQLSRNPEARADKRPLLSDLRESGSIEQDADIVIFPFRPEYYDITTDPHTGLHYPEGFTILDIAKFRNGQTGELGWVFDCVHSSFRDAD